MSAPDLTTAVPRSPSETLAGMAHVPRMLDKARAKAAGTLGEYMYPCPMDQQALAFIGLPADEVAQMAERKDDAQMADWIGSFGTTRTEGEKRVYSEALLTMGPSDEEGWQRFYGRRAEIAPGRDDVMTYAELIDLDEGR